MTYPCKNCTERYLGCHDRCEKYQAVKAKIAARRNEEEKCKGADDHTIGHMTKVNDDINKRRMRGRHHWR